MSKATPTSEWMKSMNEAATFDHRQAAETVQHPQALLELAHGEARQSLLTVHGILEARLPEGELLIYEAGGGSTSFLPLKVLRRAHVTVVMTTRSRLSSATSRPIASSPTASIS